MPDHDTIPPESWKSVHRAARKIASPIHRVLAIEATSGIVLLLAAAAALIWANLWPASYHAVWHASAGLELGGWSFDATVHFWINEGLMTIFFLVVGLEIRRELYEGSLANVRQAAIPVAAAIGGMLMPAAVFALFSAGRAGSAGWAIPMATDIAFAVGVLTLLGSRIPPGMRVLLLALAVIDDIGAILVIAVFYGGGVSPEGLIWVGSGLAAVVLLRAAGARHPGLYVVPGVVVWIGMMRTGIHPTLAGVMLGLLTPVRPWFGASGFAELAHEQLAKLAPDDDPHTLHQQLDEISRARREAVSPAEHLIHVLHPWVAYVLMPLFALANAGVALGSADLAGDGLWLFVGIVAGLVIGKPLGIALAAGAAARLGGGTTETLSRGGLLVLGCVGGIGFTMSLFIAQLAFPEGPLLATAKLAVIVGSVTAIASGLVTGLLLCRRR